MSILSRWYALPTWGKWTLGIAGVFILEAVCMAWGEHRFIAAFAECLVASVLYWGIVLGGPAVGIWTGMKVGEKTSKNWLGWIAGIAATIGFWTLSDATKEIPGVGWRIKRIEAAREAAREIENF